MIVLWSLTFHFIPILAESFFPDAERRKPSFGEMGDMFGAVNAIFSGLALAGIIITILLQKDELEAQRKELKDTREEFQYNRLTNLVYNQIKRVDDVLESFQGDFNGKTLKGNSAFNQVNADLGNFDDISVGASFTKKINKLNDQYIHLTSVYSTIDNSIHLIEKVLVMSGLKEVLKKELKLIFFSNISPEIKYNAVCLKELNELSHKLFKDEITLPIGIKKPDEYKSAIKNQYSKLFQYASNFSIKEKEIF